MLTEEKVKRIQNVAKVRNVDLIYLEIARSKKGMYVYELAKSLGIAYPTAHRSVSTLKELGLLKEKGREKAVKGHDKICYTLTEEGHEAATFFEKPALYSHADILDDVLDTLLDSTIDFALISGQKLGYPQKQVAARLNKKIKERY